MTKNDNNQKSDQNVHTKDETKMFHLKMIYPEVEDAFKVIIKPLDQIKDSCLIVLDTNVLLLPYTVGSKGLDEIKKNYTKLISESRLYIPGQSS